MTPHGQLFDRITTIAVAGRPFAPFRPMVLTKKADATGRSSGRGSKRRGSHRFVIETPFIGHPWSLRQSAGFRHLSTPARHVLDFIENEHLLHGGAENGRLRAPYNQLTRWGISRRDIRPAIDELERCGIIRVHRGERQGGRDTGHTYALTYYPTKGEREPTYDYKRVTVEDVRTFRSERGRRNAWRAGRQADLAKRGQANDDDPGGSVTSSEI